MNLQCACCGGLAPSRAQWWNRDTGYGVCERCFKAAVERDGEAEAIRTYGHPGRHHSITKPGPEAEELLAAIKREESGV